MTAEVLDGKPEEKGKGREEGKKGDKRSTGELEHKATTDLLSVPADQDTHWLSLSIGSLTPATLADAASGRPGGIMPPSPLAAGLAWKGWEHFLALGLWVLSEVVVLEDIFCGNSLGGVEGEEVRKQVNTSACK